MSESATTYERLAERFPATDHKKVKKGGREQTYIPWTDKVERFNKVLGHDWSFRVVREGMTETEAWVLGELSVTIDGVTTVRQQYGCEPIVKGQRETPTTDLFKIAGTDALSKAATLFGCGLYLSIQEEREEVEAAMQEAVRAAAAERRAASAPKATAGTSAAGGGSPASRSAATPSTTPAASSSSSTTATPAPSKSEAAAVLTGADTTPIKPMVRCTECATDVAKDGSVTILKKKDGPKVTVTVADFEPVCVQRLGSFHCAGCYDRKYWGAA